MRDVAAEELQISPGAGTRRAGGIRAALFSTYPPRACGIGTFSFDVRTALLEVNGIGDVGAVVVVDEPSPQRPEVVATVSQGVRDEYLRAARLLGRLDVDVVLLQHEYGIFGGADGEYVVAFAKELSQPLVVTLHTVLSQPSRHQLEVLRAVCDEATRVIVMTDTARRLLIRVGACPEHKVRVIPHGAPTELIRRGNDRVTSESHLRLSTFGLLSVGKGLETAIQALPYVIERHPDVRFLIAGRTHPHVARREGERYRCMLEDLVGDLELGDHVVFDDRFLSIDELGELLAATDVFITPYRNREQIASGALTFAIAAGCAAVSTPFWYAEDMLATGAGRIVPFDDPRALAEAVCVFAEQPDALRVAQAEARRLGRELAWPSVAAATAAVLAEAARLSSRRSASARSVRPRPRAALRHLSTATASSSEPALRSEAR